MKNLMTRRFGIAAFALMLAVPAVAQGPRRFSAGGASGGRGERVDYLAGYLNLTDSQKTQAEAIFDAAKTESAGVRGQLAGAREALQDAVKAGAADARIDTLAASVGTASGQLLAIGSKAASKFRALLTPEQIEKLDSRESRRRGPRGAE